MWDMTQTLGQIPSVSSYFNTDLSQNNIITHCFYYEYQNIAYYLFLKYFVRPHSLKNRIASANKEVPPAAA